MKQYHRLMRRHTSTQHGDAERGELLQVLSSAPGVEHVKIIEVHPKGGYRITFDLAPESIDAFNSYLDESDWMSVW
jgi:hypothetical protein